ncbi:MAG: hypothetical protein ACTSVK_18185 [Promethearchaeota archaeon]
MGLKQMKEDLYRQLLEIIFLDKNIKNNNDMNHNNLPMDNVDSNMLEFNIFVNVDEQNNKIIVKNIDDLQDINPQTIIKKSFSKYININGGHGKKFKKGKKSKKDIKLKDIIEEFKSIYTELGKDELKKYGKQIFDIIIPKGQIRDKFKRLKKQAFNGERKDEIIIQIFPLNKLAEMIPYEIMYDKPNFIINDRMYPDHVIHLVRKFITETDTDKYNIVNTDRNFIFRKKDKVFLLQLLTFAGQSRSWWAMGQLIGSCNNLKFA